MRSPASILLFVLALGSISTYAQTAPTQYGCEAPEVRAAFDTTLSRNELVKLTITQRAARRQQVLDALIVKNPHEYLLYREQFNMAHDPGREDPAAALAWLRERWVSNVKAHPDDPMALMLAGKALTEKDPPEAIRLLEAAQAKAPEFPWPSFELAELYWRGRYADEAKLKENLERFYSLCPSWVETTNFGNQIEGFKLRKDLPLVAKTTIAMRAELAQQTDPKRLEDYQILWQREFLTRPLSEHDAERAQIRQDLDRLEKLVPQGDAQWRLFLISGYQLAGTPSEELARMQSQAAKDFPHQAPAERLAQERWDKEHPQPEGQKDAAAWKAYYAAKIEHVKEFLQAFPDDPYLQRTEFFVTVQDDEYVSEADGLEAVDRYLKAMEDYGGYGILSTGPDKLAKFLLEHGWQPERALELLKKTSTYRDDGHTKEHWSESLDADTVKSFHRQVVSMDLENLGLILNAATLAGKPEEAVQFRAVIEEPPPENKQDLEQYWTNRARFAALDHHPEDALVYYRIALDDRTKPRVYSHGVLQDDLTVEFHALWTRQGGTEAAWAAWNPPDPAESTVATPPGAGSTASKVAAARKKPAPAVAVQEDDWKRVTKKMPSFDLSDFSGKQWRQGDFAGKIVVVVSWATWCGPCHLQDALLQKFYDKMKDRRDLAVVSLNIDENPGQVLPFMRKQGYTFPVLAAFSYEEAQYSVPRTWIIDRQGNWRWVKSGYDESKTYAEFEEDLLSQIGKAEAGQ
jgi:thiol-disulfide isomerase/thioredoxin